MQTMWERACSRKRAYIQQMCCLRDSFREQARSHRFSSTLTGFCFTHNNKTATPKPLPTFPLEELIL
ncbi:hypothetical protein QF019_006100 [Pseudomonas frederiksbergensis]